MLFRSPVKLDVTNLSDIDSAFELIQKAGTGIFGLVNNAGIPMGAPALDITDEELQTIFNINILGVHRVTRKFCPLLLDSHGRILMMSSYNGKVAIPFMAAYVMSKFGLEGYSDCLRRELQMYDIKVIIIEPGPIKTPIWDKGDVLVENYKKKTPLIKELGEIAIDAFTESIETSRKNGLPAETVAKTVYEALTVLKPKPRYPVMKNPFMFKMVYKLLSDEKIEIGRASCRERV